MDANKLMKGKFKELLTMVKKSNKDLGGMVETMFKAKDLDSMKEKMLKDNPDNKEFINTMFANNEADLLKINNFFKNAR